MTPTHENPEHAGSLGRQISQICVGVLTAAGIEPRQASENPIALNQWLSYQLMGLGVAHVVAVGYVKVGPDRTIPAEICTSGPRCIDEVHNPPSKQHAWIELCNAEIIDVSLLHCLTIDSGEPGARGAEAAWESSVLHRDHPEYATLAPLEYRRQGIAVPAAGLVPGPGVNDRNLQILLRMQELSWRD